MAPLKKTAILSVGDMIEPGIYKQHSSFVKAINFSRNEKMISVVTDKVGAGPVNIVVSDIKSFIYAEISLNENYLICNNKKYILQNCTYYNSFIDKNILNCKNILNNVVKIIPVLIEYAAPQSIAFVIDDTRKRFFSSSFEQNYYNKILFGIEKIREGEITEGVKSINGCGFGLTPSGDDFITGMLNALYLLGIITDNQQYSSLSKIINQVIQTDNLIVKNAINHAGTGRYSEPVKNLILSLSASDENKIFESVIKILQMGETSGADMLTGFLFGCMSLKKFHVHL